MGTLIYLIGVVFMFALARTSALRAQERDGSPAGSLLIPLLLALVWPVTVLGLLVASFFEVRRRLR